VVSEIKLWTQGLEENLIKSKKIYLHVNHVTKINGQSNGCKKLKPTTQQRLPKADIKFISATSAFNDTTWLRCTQIH
jgi:hypothetical protein